MSVRELERLAQRCERSVSSDWQLDAEIWCAVCAPDCRPARKGDHGETEHWIGRIYTKTGFLLADRYSSHVDEALRLVPKGWSVDITIHRNNIGNYAHVYNEGLIGEPSFVSHKNGPAALRICGPALRARIWEAAHAKHESVA